LLSGREGTSSPLASALGAPDVAVHEWAGWALLAVAAAAAALAARAVAAFVADSLTFRRADLRWLRSWPAACLSGRFEHHRGRFDPGQRVANFVILAGLLIAVASGVGLVSVHGGPAFAVLLRVHRFASYALAVVLAGHVVVASGVLAGYRGVWRSMHWGGRLRLTVARRLWPAWAAERTRSSRP
jgi:thiosulfate reductase cytochrome b subunit